MNISKCCCWVLRHFLTSQVISVASDIEREKSDRFCSEAVISAWGSFTCRNLRHGTQGLTSLPKEVIPRIFRPEKVHRPRPGSNSRTSDLEASMITTGPPESTVSLLWPQDINDSKVFLFVTDAGSYTVWSKLPNVLKWFTQPAWLIKTVWNVFNFYHTRLYLSVSLLSSRDTTSPPPSIVNTEWI